MQLKIGYIKTVIISVSFSTLGMKILEINVEFDDRLFSNISGSRRLQRKSFIARNLYIEFEDRAANYRQARTTAINPDLENSDLQSRGRGCKGTQECAINLKEKGEQCAQRSGGGGLVETSAKLVSHD